MTCICGCDPGKHGALAFLYPDAPNRVAVYDVPLAGNEIVGVSVRRIIEKHMPHTVWFERVNAMPTDGRGSAFSFGVTTGKLLGIFEACEIRVELVTPSVWKRAMKLGKDKGESRGLAGRMFPECVEHFGRVKDHNRAEAALLALYGLQQGKH